MQCGERRWRQVQRTVVLATLTRAPKSSVLLCGLEAMNSGFSSIWSWCMSNYPGCGILQLDQGHRGPKRNTSAASDFMQISEKKHTDSSSHTHTPLSQQFPQRMGYLKSTLFPPKQKQLFLTCLKSKREWEKKKKTKNFLKVKTPRDLRRNNSG